MQNNFDKEELLIFKRLMEYELDKCDKEYLEENFEQLLEKVENYVNLLNNTIT